MDNISYGDPSKSEEEIIESAKKPVYMILFSHYLMDIILILERKG